MSIKSLFNNKTKTVENASSGSVDVESKDFVLTTAQRNETFQPFIDFATASNFAKFGSAEEYYKSAIERIHNEYPYDGSENEKLQFELSSSYLDKYVLDNRYPKTNGYINLSYGGWGSLNGTIVDGYGRSNSDEYIFMRGGIHIPDEDTDAALRKWFDKSVIYDEQKNRVSSLKMDLAQGITTEFWLKKDAFDTAKTEKEVILDLWNGEASSSSDYGRFTLALSGTANGEDTFIVTLQSGTDGFYEQSIGTATVTTSSLSDWHHYALSFVSASSTITGRLYVDGELNESKSLGSTGIDEISGLINGYIGALQTSPSGSSAVQYAGKLSASIDDFRYWKTRRTSKQIYNNWYRHVGGGTNTDDANIYLGVYYKFNEGIVGTNSIDSSVLDYSGRLVNGSWTGYSSGARSTDSAFVESGMLTSEPKDPIIYSSHTDVVSLKEELMASGSAHDRENPALLYNKIPQWIRDEDESNEFATKKLYQIIASYFDTLHVQIGALPHLKNKVYPESSYKPLPFADRLLEDKGLIVANLFADSDVLEAFGDRDLNQVQFEEKISDIKNQIYTNIYNNLEDIYKHKGTEGAIRNMLRCFGVDDELVKLNVYTDQGTHYFSDAFKHTSLNKKYIDFNKEGNLGGSIFQTSSANHSLTYTSGSGTEKLEQYNALSSEVSIIVPKKLGLFDQGYFKTTFQSASVFGMHGAASDSADYTWGASETTTTPQTAAIEFTMVTSASLDHQAVLELTAGSDTALVVYADPNQALTTDPSTIDHIVYTGSVGMALANGNSTAARLANTSYSGIDTVDGQFSISYWFNRISGSVNSSTTYIQMLDTNNDTIVLVNPLKSNDLEVFVSASSTQTLDFTTIVSGTDVWNHYTLVFDFTNIATGGAGPYATVSSYKNGSFDRTLELDTLSASANSIDELRISIANNSSIQDVVLWSKALTSEDVNRLYGNGQWVNPTSVSSSAINDWYRYGYESDFDGATDGQRFDDFGASPTVNSSTSTRHLSPISTADASRLEFHTGSNPFGAARTDTQIRDELEVELDAIFTANFGDTSYTLDGSTAIFTLESGSTGPTTIAASVVSASFTIADTNDGSDLTSAVYSDLANFQVYLVRDELESSSGKFLLKDYDGTITLESPVYKEVYSNEPWNISVRIKPEDYPIAGNVVTSSNRNYVLEFYGVNHAFDTIKNEFFLTQSLNYETGSAYLSNAKRFYVGAHRTNFTGSVLEQTDIKAGRFNLWYDYVGNDEVKLHNRDVSSKGNKRTARPSTMFSKDLEGYEIPSYELLAADWDFELVSTSDSSGEFITVDASSGSTDTRYGWIDNIVRREHRAKGFGFPASTTIAANEIVYSSKKELPEIGYSADGVTIKGEREEYFIEDEDVSDNFYALEKSMYQTISEEMMRTLSTAQEMSNLMGEAVERYRLEYKKLNHVRRMFFEDVEEDPDFDRFTEYFKWIDSSVSYMVSQMFPMSVRFSKGISDVVESHLFERNKYQNKFPLITTHTATEGRIVGIGQSKYRWEFGHAPVEAGAGDNDNCLWQKQRAERTDIEERETIRQIIGNRNNADGTTVSGSSGTYTTSTYGIRRFSETIQMNSVISQTLHPGINYSLQKDREYVWSAVGRHSSLAPTGVPKNVLLVGAGTGQGIELPVECDDVEIPNQKKKFNTIVHVGKQATGSPGGAFKPINDSASYSYAVKGAYVLPFEIFSGSVTTGYNARVSSGYKSDAIITNLHTDTTDFSNDIPLQGPFTQQWVGGHQARHVDLNRYDTSLIDGETLSAPTNNIHNLYTRPEAWRLLLVENTGPGSDGAVGLVDPEYGVTAITGHPNTGSYPDVAKKSATLYRDGRTKRAMNIANIQTTTSSVNHGNFTENYEIVSIAGGKKENNLFFRRNSETHDFLPDAIADALPETTNYQTLVGVSNHPSGNVFGVGESNVLNATVENFRTDDALLDFSLQRAQSANDRDKIEIDIGATNTIVEIDTDGTSSVSSDIVLEQYRRAFKESTDSGVVQMQNTSYSGLSNGDLSVSFWFNNTTARSASPMTAANSTRILFRDGTTTLYEIRIYDDIHIIVNNSSGTLIDTDEYSAGIASGFPNQWVHVTIVLEVSSLGTMNPVVYLNSNKGISTTYTPPGGSITQGTIDQFYVLLRDGDGIQDLAFWDKVLNSTEVSTLYNSGDWLAPRGVTFDPSLVDWWQFGNEEYWYSDSNGTLLVGETLDSYQPSSNKYISSSVGTGESILIGTAYDEDIEFIIGKGYKEDSQYWQRLSSSLEDLYSNFTMAYSTTTSARFVFTQDVFEEITVDATITGTNFFSLTEQSSTTITETGYLNTTTIATESVTRTVISSRFSAPGSIDTLTYGFLDAYSQEYSVYNSLNYRNLSVRGAAVRVSASADGSDFYNFGGSGEDGTIRIDNHLTQRDSHKALLSRHCGKYGVDTRNTSYSTITDPSITEANFQIAVNKPSFHKQQRNENRRPTSGSTIASPVFVTRHDNMYVNSAIPRSDFQYKWVTSSIGSNYSITSGKQRMYGYAHPTGILSSSVTIDGDSGFVPAITFPTASEIFGE